MTRQWVDEMQRPAVAQVVSLSARWPPSGSVSECCPWRWAHDAAVGDGGADAGAADAEGEMSRSNYSDDFGEDFPGQLELYRANVDRAFYSKAGRARLADLLAALNAMPVKELADDVFIEKRPEDEARPGAKMCALGVWAANAMGDDAQSLFRGSEPGAEETASALAGRGWPKLVVYDVIYVNDEYRHGETDAQRWQRVRGWVARRLEEMDARDARVMAWKAAHPCTTPSTTGVGLL